MKIHPLEVAHRCAHDLEVTLEELEAALTDSRFVTVEPIIQDMSTLDATDMSGILRAKCREHMAERTIHVIGHRPSQAPVSWEIWNAPRPIYGQELWQGEFMTGIFYAAINPWDEFSAGLRYENVTLRASLLVYIDEEDHRDHVERYRKEMLPKFPRFADAEFEMVEQSYINRSPIQIVKVQE